MSESRATPDNDASRRLSGLDELARLWGHGGDAPSARTARFDRSGQSMLIVAGRRRPRLLVPSWRPRAAATATLRSSASGSARERVQRRAVATLLRAGLGPHLFPSAFPVRTSPEGTLINHLGGLLGDDIVAAAALTPARANRKPILHLLDRSGRTVAFAKVGVNDLTRRLVDREAETLRTLADVSLQGMTIPEVLFHGTFDGLSYVVLSPLPSWAGRQVVPATLGAAMRELSAAGPHGPGEDDAYLSGLATRANALAPVAEQDARSRDVLLDVIPVLASRAADDEVRFGRWHGDWTSWNCCQVDDRVLVWDWERSERPVPLGFDAVHHHVQSAIAAGKHPRVVAADCLDRAPALLADWTVGARAARTTAALYLVEIALRYIHDDQISTGGRAGDVSTWLIPSLLTEVLGAGKDAVS